MATVDFQGIALVITAIGSTAGLLVGAYVTYKNSKKLDAIHAVASDVKVATDGMNTQLKAQNLALKVEVARVAREGEGPTPVQTPGVAGNAPVGISEGVVTAETQGVNRRAGDPPTSSVPEDTDEPTPS